MHTYVQIQDKEHIIHSPYCIGSVCSSPPLAFSSFWLYVPGPTLGTVLPEGWVSGLGAWSYILQRRTLTAYYSCENITKDKLYIALLYNYSNSDVIDSCCCCYGSTNLRLLVSGSLVLWLRPLQFLIACSMAYCNPKVELARDLWEQIDSYNHMLSAKQIPSLKASTDVCLEGSGHVNTNQCNNFRGMNGTLSLYNARN